MNTPAHLIFSAAAFARPGEPRVNLAALLGALAPDLSLYLLTGVSIFILGVSAETVFRTYYYSSEWQQIFAVDNSFVLWGIAFAFAAWLRSRAAMVFCGSALLHLAFDFPLHNHDARQHFWPLTDWVFVSPLSYWDNAHYGRIVSLLEGLASAALLVVLWIRFKGPGARILVAGIGTLQLAPLVIWSFLFN